MSKRRSVRIQGGPHDGQRYSVDEGIREVKLAHIPKADLDPGLHRPISKRQMKCGVALYRQAGDTAVFLFAGFV